MPVSVKILSWRSPILFLKGRIIRFYNFALQYHSFFTLLFF